MNSKRQWIKAVAAISAVVMATSTLLPGCNFIGQTSDDTTTTLLSEDANAQTACCPVCNSTNISGPDENGMYTCNDCGGTWSIDETKDEIDIVDSDGDVIATVDSSAGYISSGSSSSGSYVSNGGSSSGSSSGSGSSSNSSSSDSKTVTTATTKATVWSKIKNGISDPTTFKQVLTDLKAIGGSVEWIIDDEGNLTAKSVTGKDTGFFGFKYNTTDKIFITAEDPWQRNFGYVETYDRASGIGAISYDTARIKYNYNGKDWMVQLWKGQYGFAFIGAEVGVYNRDEGKSSTFYNCVTDDEKFTMEMTIYRGTSGQNSSEFKKLFTRSKCKTWWLTGFTPGTLNAGSYVVNEEGTKLVRQDIIIYFETSEEAQAFISGLKNCNKIEHNAPTTTNRNITFKEVSINSYDKIYVDGKYALADDGKTLYLSWR